MSFCFVYSTCVAHCHSSLPFSNVKYNNSAVVHKKKGTCLQRKIVFVWERQHAQGRDSALFVRRTIHAASSSTPKTQLETFHFHSTMALLNSADPPVFQRFVSRDCEPLASLLAKTCSQTGKRCIFWIEIQNDLKDVVCLKDRDELIVLFMIDQDGELYVSFYEETVQNASKFTHTKSHFPTSRCRCSPFVHREPLRPSLYREL